jgi:hypothetical protein
LQTGIPQFYATEWHFPFKSPNIQKQTNLKNGPFMIPKLLGFLPESEIIFSAGIEKSKSQHGDNEWTRILFRLLQVCSL